MRSVSGPLARIALVSCENSLQDSIVNGAAVGGAASAITGGSVVKGAAVGGVVGAVVEEAK